MSKFSNAWKQLWKDRFLVLLCLILAFLGWQGIRKTIGFEISVSNISVEVEPPAGWAVWEKSMQRVNIVFRGSREDIRYLNSDQLHVTVPLQDPVRGEEMTIKLSETFLQNPTGAKVVSFSPDEIVIRLDQEGEKLLPVKALVKGNLPEGLEVERIICSPAAVRVFGAQQTLDAMENIQTEEVDLKNRQSSFKESVPIAQANGRMSVKPDWVSVEVVLEERNREAVYEKIPVRIMCASGDSRKFKVFPEIVNVKVQGQKDQIESIRSTDIFAYVSCDELTENASYELPVLINLPVNVQSSKAEPATVQVDISGAK